MATAFSTDSGEQAAPATGGRRVPAARRRRLRSGSMRASHWLALSLFCAALHVVPQVYGAEVLDATLPKAQLLRRTLQSDPQQEYLLYIPTAGGQAARLFVTVHGISRNAIEHATLFTSYAETYGVVLLAPFFTEDQHGDYQRLGRSGRGKRADLALDAIVTEVASLTGATADKIYLFGFSGGAQFAHRYTMAHPERVAHAVIAAAGWYTFPDAATPYPYGIGASKDLPSVSFEPETFLRVPMSVFVGDKDLSDKSLRHNQEVDEQQGVTRLERARNWVAAMRAAAERHHLESNVSYEQVAGIEHSFKQFMLEGQLGDRTFRSLFGTLEAQRAGAARR